MNGHEHSIQNELLETGHQHHMHMADSESKQFNNNELHIMAGVEIENCDCSCLACFSVTSIVNPAIARSSQYTGTDNPVTYTTFFPSHFSDPLFRPPISA